MKHFTFKTSIVARNDDDRQRLIDELAATGVFTARDKGALLIMHIDGLRAIHKSLVGASSDADEADTELEEVTNSYEDFAHSHRPKAFRRKPRVVIPRLAVHGVTDAEAIGMVPPSSRSR